MSEKCELSLYPSFNPGAFVLALFLAPLVVAIMGFGVLLIPVFAVPFGMVPYLIFGGPVLFCYMKWLPYVPAAPMALLLAVHIAVFGGEAHLAKAALGLKPADIGLRLKMGTFFAPLWGVAFECLYAIFWHKR